MVNYCCVFGCRRNSRENKQLNYYSLPKERERRLEWLVAAQRVDLLHTNKLSVSYRICSRHFPLTSLKNRYLSPDAVPTLNLPGANNQDSTCDPEPMSHKGIACNNCEEEIKGFRYKCVTCKDYDLCTKCETREHHDHHFMLRIPRPIKFKDADNLLKKWRNLSVSKTNRNHEDANELNELKTKIIFEDSSDDEPITKYLSEKQRNACLLSKDVKRKIHAEVLRVFKLKKARSSANEKSTCNNKGVTNGLIKTRRKRATQAPERCSKRSRKDGDSSLDSGKAKNTVEVAFADVNDFGNNEIVNEVKIEVNDVT